MIADSNRCFTFVAFRILFIDCTFGFSIAAALVPSLWLASGFLFWFNIDGFAPPTLLKPVYTIGNRDQLGGRRWPLLVQPIHCRVQVNSGQSDSNHVGQVEQWIEFCTECVPKIGLNEISKKVRKPMLTLPPPTESSRQRTPKSKYPWWKPSSCGRRATMLNCNWRSKIFEHSNWKRKRMDYLRAVRAGQFVPYR